MKRNKMLFFFCKSLFLAVTCVWIGSFSSGAVADDSSTDKTTEEWKTVSVISFTSADTGIATVKQLVKAAGHEGVIDSFEKLARENFKTMDFSNPKGFVVQTNGKAFRMFLFLPLNDVTALPFEIGKKIAASEKDENGWYKIPLPTHNFLFVNQQKGWAYATLGPRLPKSLPENPVTLLEGLDKEYLIAARFNAQNMPKSILGGYAMIGKQMIPMVRMVMPMASQDQPEEVREVMTNYFDFVEKMIGNAIDMMVKTCKETETMTYGFKVNDANDLIVESRVVVLPDTETAKIIAETAKMKTNLIGFFHPEGTIFSVIGAEYLSDTYKKFFKDYLEGYVNLFAPLLKKARDAKNKPEEADKLLDGIEGILKAGLEIAGKTIDSGRIDVTETVFTSGSLLIAFSVVDGKRLIPAIDPLFELAQASLNKEYGKDYVKFEKISYADCQIWSLSSKFSDMKNSGAPKSLNDESFSMMFVVGDRLLALSYGLGTSEEHLDRMKKGIDAAKTEAAVPDTMFVFTPQQLGVLLKKFVDLSQGQLQKPAQILYDAPQDARVTITRHFGTPNVVEEKMVVSGKLMPTFGRFGEIIAEQIKNTVDQYRKEQSSRRPRFSMMAP